MNQDKQSEVIEHSREAREILAADELMDRKVREIIFSGEPFGSVSIPCALRAIDRALSRPSLSTPSEGVIDDISRS